MSPDRPLSVLVVNSFYAPFVVGGAEVVTEIETPSEPAIVCSRKVLSSIPHYGGCGAEREAEPDAFEVGRSCRAAAWRSGELEPVF